MTFRSLTAILLLSLALSACGSEDGDMTSPVIALDSQYALYYQAYGYYPTIATEATLTGSSTDPESEFEWYVSSEPTGADSVITDNSPTGLTWSGTISAMSVDGTYIPVMSASDKRGNISQISLAIRRDTTAPAVAENGLTATAETITILFSETLELDLAHPTDTDSNGIPEFAPLISSADFTLDSAPFIGGFSYAPLTNTATLTPSSPLAAGDHTLAISATVKDAAGNSYVGDPLTFTVTTP